MSFSYEEIENESYSRFSENMKGIQTTRFVKVTPIEFSEYFPISVADSNHCVLSNQWVNIYLKKKIFVWLNKIILDIIAMQNA